MFPQKDDGVTAIEFALLALPFFSLIGIILETGIYLLISQVFDSAVDDASRLIMIGDAAASNYSPETFKDRICDHTFGLIDCPLIKLRVRHIASFSVADTSPPVDSDGNWILPESFQAGKPSKVMLVEAYYKWDTFLGLDFGFAKYGNSVVLSSARVFMNEPFP
ncbi:TadE/TadG family type IV pilus assembly protein [Maritalea sp.]|uniref:TadE/TadG family type IV pilus assembly protein n=1 Tax=Maritalea sp. TaxID=2003361 RepID=UPI003EF7B4EA